MGDFVLEYGTINFLVTLCLFWSWDERGRELSNNREAVCLLLNLMSARRLNMIKILAKNNGFTMIEVMAGIVLLTIGLLLLMPMMVVSMRGNNIARGSTESSMLIRDKIEELKNATNPISGIDTLGNQVCTWTVSDAGANLRRLLVKVDWSDREGLAHSNSMVTYMMVE
jgi:prepilin-type N-terminal cleavage/methylation domain-containing protein